MMLDPFYTPWYPTKYFTTLVTLYLFLIKIPFFETLLKFLKPSFHKRLYESLEVNNSLTQEQLGFQNLYTVEEGIKYMIHGENR